MFIWFTDPDKESSEQIARRIAVMLFGEDKIFDVETGESDWKWQIGTNNDFWLREQPDGVLKFGGRYFSDEAGAAYRYMFERHLGFRLIENPKKT